MNEIIKGPLEPTYECALRVIHNYKKAFVYFDKFGDVFPGYKEVLKELEYFEILSDLKAVSFFNSCLDEWHFSVSRAMSSLENIFSNQEPDILQHLAESERRCCETLQQLVPKLDLNILMGPYGSVFIRYSARICFKALRDMEESKAGVIIVCLARLKWIRKKISEMKNL